MIYFLIFLVVILYLSGAVLMRALLKEAGTNDQDSLIPVLLWPYFILAPVAELIFKRKFKW